MKTRLLLSLYPVITLCATMQYSTANAGQVQITIDGSANSVCCGIMLDPVALDRSYTNTYQLPGLQFAHEGASVNVDLTTGTLRGESYVTSTSNFWLGAMGDGFKIVRDNPGAGVLVPFEMRVEVNASSGLNSLGDYFSSVTSSTRLELGRLNAFQQLSDIDFAQFNWQHTIDTVGQGGSDTDFSNLTGDVLVDSANKTGYKVTLLATREAFISDNNTESSLFGFSYWLNAQLFGSEGGGGYFDATHTAQVFLDLPEGYSILSDSGVFLSQPPPAVVPLPASAWLMVSGLGLLLTRLQFRKSTV